MADTEPPEGLELVGEHGGKEERDVWGNTHVARAPFDTARDTFASAWPLRCGGAPSATPPLISSATTSVPHSSLMRSMRHEWTIYQVRVTALSVHSAAYGILVLQLILHVSAMFYRPRRWHRRNMFREYIKLAHKPRRPLYQKKKMKQKKE